MFEFIGALLLVLLAMVSYSAGITLVAKNREYPTSIVDLLLVAGLWLAVFWLRPQLDRWLLLVLTLGMGVVVGVIVAAIRLGRQNTAVIIPESELPEHAREEGKGETAVSPNIFKRSWHRWNVFAGRLGNVQGRLLMGFFYFIFVTPFGLVARLLSDPMDIKKVPDNSNWKAKEQTDLTIEAAAEQG